LRSPTLAQTTDSFYFRSDGPASGRKRGIIFGRLCEAVCGRACGKIQAVADDYDESRRICFSKLGIVADVWRHRALAARNKFPAKLDL
jgi:hypothetical protein